MDTILVVDDDDDIRSTVAELLADEGYSVETASNGQLALVALETMASDQPVLVLLDLMMPVMTGAEVLGVLAETGRLPALNVVVVSAHPEQAKGLGARRLLSKPFSLDVLLQTIHEVCDTAPPQASS